jgi:hypothetical protein
VQPAEFREFTRALCEPSAPLPRALRAPADAALTDRFAVYRNNVHVSLVAALEERFPIARALVGAEFFGAMARAYVQDHKPASELLHEYGSDLPQFVAAFVPAAALPYLADVARMEAAWSESWAAPDAAPLQLATLSSRPADALADARAVPHPAMRLIQSDWPIGSIWQAHQAATPDLSAIPWHAQCVLITRPEATIQLQQLPAGAATFAIALLLQRLSIADAAAAALTQSPQLDIGRQLGALIECGAILEIITS